MKSITACIPWWRLPPPVNHLMIIGARASARLNAGAPLDVRRARGHRQLKRRERRAPLGVEELPTSQPAPGCVLNSQRITMKIKLIAAGKFLIGIKIIPLTLGKVSRDSILRAEVRNHKQ